MLHIDKLIVARKSIIDSVMFGDQSIYDDLEAELIMYKTPDEQGKLDPFVNVIIFTLEYLMA